MFQGPQTGQLGEEPGAKEVQVLRGLRLGRTAHDSRVGRHLGSPAGPELHQATLRREPVLVRGQRREVRLLLRPHWHPAGC